MHIHLVIIPSNVYSALPDATQYNEHTKFAFGTAVTWKKNEAIWSSMQEIFSPFLILVWLGMSQCIHVLALLFFILCK